MITREFLKGLDLENEKVDVIMAEVGKKHNALKEQIDDYKAKCVEYESKITELNNTIESNNKSLENLQTLTNENNGLKNENNDLKAEIQMNGSNVKKEFSKFVRSEVMANVKDDVDFATALNTYKESNPQFFGETKVVKTQSSPVLAGGTQPQTTNDIMNSLIRGSRE